MDEKPKRLLSFLRSRTVYSSSLENKNCYYDRQLSKGEGTPYGSVYIGESDHLVKIRITEHYRCLRAGPSRRTSFSN